jgi:hypothetical protein
MAIRNNRATAEVARPKAKPIKVSIKRNARTGTITVDHGKHEAPSFHNVLAGIPVAQQKNVEHFWTSYGYRDFSQLITASWPSLSLEAWASAIAVAIARSMDAEHYAEANVMPNVTDNIYIAIGDVLLKANAIGLVGTNRALQVVKQRAIAVAEQEAERIVTTAKGKGEQLLLEARTNAENINVSAQRVRRDYQLMQSNMALIPPRWAVESNRHLWYQTDYARWCIKANLSLTLKTFTDGEGRSDGRDVRIWPAKRALPVDIPIWIPIHHDGRYDVTLIRTERYSFPHIGTGGACMRPATAPAQLASLADLSVLLLAIQTCLADTNLNSLLVKPYAWSEEVWKFVPTALEPHFKAWGTDRHAGIPATVRAPNQTDSIKDEEIWRITTPETLAPPTPEPATPQPITEATPPPQPEPTAEPRTPMTQEEADEIGVAMPTPEPALAEPF